MTIVKKSQRYSVVVLCFTDAVGTLAHIVGNLVHGDRVPRAPGCLAGDRNQSNPCSWELQGSWKVMASLGQRIALTGHTSTE